MNYELQQDLSKIIEDTAEDDLFNDYKVKVEFVEMKTDCIDNVNLDRVRVQRKIIRNISNENQEESQQTY